MVFGIIIQLFGVTIFASVMTNFQEVLNRGNEGGNREEKLQAWFSVIKDIRMSPFNKCTEIKKEMKEEIERHFQYFWDNDRTSVLREKFEYFDSIPFKI
jgi:hypothetical protein